MRTARRRQRSAAPTAFGRWARLASAWLTFAVCAAGARALALGDDKSKGSVKLEATYTADAFADIAGGQRRGLAHLGNVQLTLGVDAPPLLGLPPAHLFLHTLTVFGGYPSAFVGDVQGVDNNAAPHIPLSLYEAWVTQTLLEDRFSLLVGYYDLNSEFDVSHPGTLFVHAAQGIGSVLGLSGADGPSIYPRTSFGARLKLVPVAPVYAQFALLNGVAGDVGGARPARFLGRGEGFLIVGEAGAYVGLSRPASNEPGARRSYIRRQQQAHYRVKLALGAWVYTQRFADISSLGAASRPAVHSGDQGIYALVDARLVPQGSSEQRGLWAFARAGGADPHIDRYPWFLGGGVVYAGLPGRAHDELGMAFALAIAGAPLRRVRQRMGEQLSSYELDCELTYLAPVTDWLTLVADLQYVVHPSASARTADALAAIVRYQIAF